MSTQAIFGVTFGIYILLILFVGLRANRKVQDSADYSVAGRRMGAGLGALTFAGTYVSALTVVGLVGSASIMGLALVPYTFIGLAIGLVALVLFVKRLHDAGTTSESVPEVLGKRFEDKYVRVGAGAASVIGYFFYLVAQLFAVGVLLSATLGFPVPVVVLVVGLVFVSYTLLGGLHAVAKTDAVQVVILTCGILLTLMLVVQRIGSSPNLRWSDGPGLSAFLGGPAPTWGLALGWALSWMLGVACQPNYMQRILACPDAKTARLMVGWGSTISFWLANVPVLVIGIGIAIIMPESSGDDALPTFLLSEGGSLIAALAIVGLLSAVMSTTDSLLHILGVYCARDIVAPFRGDDATNPSLKSSRIATGSLGILAVLMATFMAFKPLPLVLEVAAYAVGILGAGLFVPLYGGLLWRRATKLGARLAMVTGIPVLGLTEWLRSNGYIELHGMVFAIGISAAAMVIGSLVSERIRPGGHADRPVSPKASGNVERA